jgi:putative two-component system hydrogenase maturation factor HypX/HoxX
MTFRRQPILFLVSAHNGLSQRAWIALTERGHEVVVAVVDSDAAMEAAVAEHRPWLIASPFLRRMIPESIWSRHRCLIVHPGPVGDRGPSSLDWGIALGAREWGVTVLEANGEFDAGEVLASRAFAMREVGKTSLYRHEVRRAAVEALVEAVERIERIERVERVERVERIDGRVDARPVWAVAGGPTVSGCARPLMRQDVRAIDWHSDCTDTVLRKLRAAEGSPGVLDEIDGVEFHLFGGHRERSLRGRPSELIATRDDAICRGTVDGAVWITHLKRRDSESRRSFKLPAVRALSLAGIEPAVPEVKVTLTERLSPGNTFREIAYSQRGAVGYVTFDFYNGAMSSDQCRRLRKAYAYARAHLDARVIVLMGGGDYFSNGIHLNVIEAADDPAAESWRNLNAIDDLVRDIVRTDSHLVISALGGDAGAGGVPLALAADIVLAREDAVLNPYYQHMGGLYGSEYWTYLLPRRVGADTTARLTSAPFTPIGAPQAARIGLIDDAFGASLEAFHDRTRLIAERLAGDPTALQCRLDRKRRRRAADERVKPLEAYRREELARSHACFFGPDPSYHEARRRFVYKSAGPVPARAAAACVAA